MEIPKFVTDKSSLAYVDDNAVEEQERKENGGKRFTPGKYEVVINNAYFSGVANDPNWYKFVVEFGTGVEGDEKSIRSYHMTPLNQNINYQKPGGKRTLFCWKTMFSPLFVGIGETAKQSTLADLQKRYFSTLNEVEVDMFDEGEGKMVPTKVPQISNLVGKKLEVVIGYEGAYVEREGDEFAVKKNGQIVEKDGSPLIGESFDECQVLAMEHDIELTNISVLKILPGKVEVLSPVVSELEAL